MHLAIACLLLLQVPEEFVGRFGPKENLVARGGGGRDTETAVLAALKWLSRHESENGSWHAATLADRCRRLPRHKEGPPCAAPGPLPVAGKPTDEDARKVVEFDEIVDAGTLEEREAATRDLVGRGPRILALLRSRAVEAKSDEVRTRLASVIDAIVRRVQVGERVSATSMALLSYLGAGYGPLSRDVYEEVCFGDVVARGLTFLLKEQKADGGWADCGAAGLATAALALCEASALTPGDGDLRKAAMMAVKALAALQGKDGAWAATTGAGSDPMATVAAAWALHTAEAIEIDVKKPLDGLRQWHASRRELTQDRRDLAALGTAIILTERRRTPELVAIATELGKTEPPADELPMVTAAVAGVIFHADGPRGEHWKRWNERERRRIVANQNSDGESCRMGSWDSPGASNDRLRTTVQYALALETYYRHPVLAR